MEHKLILGGEQYLPFARSRIKALRATGLKYATQRYIMPGGEEVRVQIVGDQEYIEMRGGIQSFSVGIVSNRIVVRTKIVDGPGPWKAHSTFEYAYSSPTDFVPFIKLNKDRFLSLSPRSTNVIGSTSGSPSYKFMDGFGKGTPIYEGANALYLGGPFWTYTAWVISTDGAVNAGSYVFRAEDLTLAGTADARNVIWKCDHNAFGTSVLTAKPAMWAFTYDPGTHGGRPLKTLMNNAAYIGAGKFVYSLGGSSYMALSPRDADSKMAIVVTQDFETFTSYGVLAGIGSVFGTDDYELSSVCYIGNGKCMVTGYTETRVIIFDSANGSMVARSTSDAGWSTTLFAIQSLGDDSACYWRYTPSATALNTAAQFTYTTDAGVTWVAKPITCVDEAGAPLTVELYLGNVSIRKPLRKSGATITSNGVIATVFHVAGVGHCEFQTTDLGTTWMKKGLISTVAPTSYLGLLYRTVLYGAPNLNLVWG